MTDKGRVRTFQVPAERAGERLDKFLVEHVAEVTRSRLQRWIREGRVRVGGLPCLKPGMDLEPGAQVELDQPIEEEAVDWSAEAEKLVVLHADEQILVFDKPAGLLVHPGKNGEKLSLALLADLRFGPLPQVKEADRPGVVHRLDRQTSGVIVMARNEQALSVLQYQFRQRLVDKHYSALVYGNPRFCSDWIETPIGKDPRHPERFCVSTDAEAKEASTYYEVKERFHGFAWLEVRPKTGRTHQIRVHLTSAGHALVGDALYRHDRQGNETLLAQAPPLYRQALHARELTLTHPASGERLCFAAPVPRDLEALLQWLRLHRNPE